MTMRAFTLIETIIYIALLSILMGSSLLAAYQILHSSAATSGHDAVGMEGEFVLRKLAWALGGAKSVSVSAHAIDAKRYDDSVVSIRQGANSLEQCEQGTCQPITTSQAGTSTLDATRISGIDGSAGVEATVTLNGREFYIKKYVGN